MNNTENIQSNTPASAAERFAAMMEAVQVLSELSEQIGLWAAGGHTLAELQVLLEERSRLVESIRELGASL